MVYTADNTQGVYYLDLDICNERYPNDPEVDID